MYRQPFRPTASAPTPAVLMMHGGAWMEGSPETHWDNAVAVAARTGATVLSIAYALTPEHPFPVAIEQCITVARWVHANAATLGLDASRLALWGDSAGGNLAAALALALRDAGIAVCAQVLVYPALAFDRNRPSCRENADGPVIVVSTMDFVDNLYCRRPGDRLHPLAAPLLAADHRGLAPAMIAVAEFDPLRDDGRANGERRHIAITGGTLRGPALSGVILPGGPDWLWQRTGEAVEPSDYYFRTAPVFDAPDGPHDWLRNRVFVGSARPAPGCVRIAVYCVD